MIPVMMIGAFSIFLNHLPLECYQEFMVSLFGERWNSMGIYIHRGTFAIMAAGMLLTISYSITRNSVLARKHEVNPMIASIVALASLFAMMYVHDGYMLISWIGPLGVFIAIIIACLSSLIFISLSAVPLLRVRLYSNAADQNLSQSISSLFPAMITITLFALFHVIMQSMGIEDIHKTLDMCLKNMFTGISSDLPTAVIFIALIHVFWFFGIHGNNVLEPVTQNLFVPALEVNRLLAAQGLQPSEIFTKQFFDVFVLLGGSGTTLCLIIALLLWTRRSNTRQIAAISALPGIFNVNEIMIFGIPLILNFYLIIPFIFLPVLLTVITFLAMKLELVHLTIAQIEWTTPIFIGGYKATGSVSGSLLQLFNLAAGILFYLPFIRMYERHLEKGQEAIMNDLLHEVNHLSEIKNTILVNRTDDIGNVSRLLVRDMENDLYTGRISLVYQPQMNSGNRMIGMEALLRWKHESFGAIAPPITIALAEESPMMYKLGLWIIKTACLQMKEWNDRGMKNITLSINISPYQLDDEMIVSQVKAILDETGISPSRLELEITEQTALGGINRVSRLHKFKETGIKIAMDDFGMGHSSLMYLKELNLDTIKLDGALIQEVLTNPKCTEIIGSIVHLGTSMGINVIAEFVDSREQQRKLEDLGCLLYQGYLYSPPLTPDRLEKFYNLHNR